jgi:hypothetical protein
MNRATIQANSSASEGTSDSEIVLMDLAVLSELNKGLYCASKAQAANDDSEGKRSWIQNANAAYENARHLLAHSPFPMSDPSVHQKLARLESLLKVSREE